MADIERIGRYEIIEELGRGGMATVYLAFDPRFDRRVAIKVLPPQFTHDPKFLARFETEAKTIASLEHPAIVPVHDFGEHQGAPYLVMRYMVGGSLRGRMRGEPLLLNEIAPELARLAPGLDEAHRQGIIHRDIKPANVLFDRDGRPYLADFGVARLADATRTMTVVGTPAYMSPEQVQGDQVLDGRSDIYGLGVMLYELLTGVPPYTADTPTKQMLLHILEPVPDILAVNPALPPAMQEIIDKSMAKDRRDRYDTVVELAAAVADLARTEEPEEDQEEAAIAVLAGAATAREEPETDLDQVTEVADLEPVEALPELETVADPPPDPPLLAEAAADAFTADETVLDTPPDLKEESEQVAAMAAASDGGGTSPPQDSGGLIGGLPAWVWWAGALALLLLVVWGLRAALIGGDEPQPEPTTTMPLVAELDEEADETVTPSPTSQPLRATDTAVPLKTASPTKRLTESPTATATPDPDALPPGAQSDGGGTGSDDAAAVVYSELPVLAGTPVPQPAAAISPANAAQVEQLASWGKGTSDVVAYSPDGRYFAVGGSLGIHLYDAETREEVGFLDPDEATREEISSHNFSNRILALTFSPDSELLASGSTDATVQVWRVNDGQRLHTFEEHTRLVDSIAFSPDGSLLASGSTDDYTVRLWRVSDGTEFDTLSFKEDRSEIHALAFSSDGQTLYTGGDELRYWRVSDGRLLKKIPLETYKQGVMSMAFSNNRQKLAAGLNDHVRIWRVSDGRLLFIEQPYEDKYINMRAVAFSPDDLKLAVGSSDDNVYLWSLSNGDLLLSLEGHTDWIDSVEFSPDGLTLVSGAHDDTVRLWRVSDGQLLDTVDGFTSAITAMDISPDSEMITTGSRNGLTRLWQVNDGEITNSWKSGMYHGVNDMSFSPDAETLAAASNSGFVQFWQMSEGQEIESSINDGYGTNALAYSPDGELLATAVRGRGYDPIRLWRVNDEELVHSLEAHTERPTSLAFSPDGEILASGAGDKIAILWRARDGELLHTLEGHEGGISSVVFAPDGNTLASGSSDDTIRLWQVSDGRLLRVLEGDSRVYSVAFAPDGETLATGGSDGTVRLWRTSDGEMLQTLEGHMDVVNRVAFTVDGKTVVSGSRDGSVRLWGIPVGGAQ